MNEPNKVHQPLSEIEQQRLMDFLYGAMDPSMQAAFLKQAAEKPELQQELRRLQKLQAVLQRFDPITAPVPQPQPSPPVYAEPDESASRPNSDQGKAHIPRNLYAATAEQASGGAPWWKHWLAAAALLLIFFAGGALSGFQAGWEEGRFYAGFGSGDDLIAPTEARTDAGLTENVQGEASPAAEPATPPQPQPQPQPQPKLEPWMDQQTFERLQRQQLELFAGLLLQEREQQLSEMQQLLEAYAQDIETRRLIDLQLIGAELDETRTALHRRNLEQELVLSEIIEFIQHQQYLNRP